MKNLTLKLFVQCLVFLYASHLCAQPKGVVSTLQNDPYFNTNFAWGLSGWTPGRGTTLDTIKSRDPNLFKPAFAIDGWGDSSFIELITDSLAADEHSNHKLKILPFGFKTAVKLGKIVRGKNVAALYREFKADSTQGLRLGYAVVAEKPGHGDGHDPYGYVIVRRKATGEIICNGYHLFIAKAGQREYEEYESIVYSQNFRFVTLDTRKYHDEVLTVEFISGGCALGAHGAVMYLVAETMVPEIRISRCDFNTYTLTAFDGYAQYKWNTGHTTPSIKVSRSDLTQKKKYEVKMTDLDGCVSSLSFVPHDSLLSTPVYEPQMAPSDTVYLCEGERTDLATTDEFAEYTWTANHWDKPRYSPSVSVAVPGTYTLRVTTYLGCDYQQKIVVRNYPDIKPDFNYSKACQGEDALFTNASGLVKEKTDSLAWEFFHGAQAQRPYQIAAGDSVAHRFAQPGTYVVRLTVFSADGCQAEVEKMIEIFPSPLAYLEIKSNTVCQGEKLEFQANYKLPQRRDGRTDKILAFVWASEKAGLADTTSTPYFSYTFAQAGKYPFTLTLITENGCTAISERIIQVAEPPIISIDAQPACGLAIQFSAISPQSLDDVEFIWAHGDGSTVRQTSPVHQYLYSQPGIYNVVLRAVNSAGCFYTATQKVKVTELKIEGIDFSYQVDDCGQTPVSFVGHSEIPGKFFWQVQWNSLAGQEVAHQFDKPGIYPVTMRFEDEEGLCYGEITKKVEICEPHTIKLLETIDGTHLAASPTETYFGKAVRILNTATGRTDKLVKIHVPMNYQDSVQNSAGCTSKDNILIKD